MERLMHKHKIAISISAQYENETTQWCIYVYMCIICYIAYYVPHAVLQRVRKLALCESVDRAQYKCSTMHHTVRCELEAMLRIYCTLFDFFSSINIITGFWGTVSVNILFIKIKQYGQFLLKLLLLFIRSFTLNSFQLNPFLSLCSTI